MTKLSSTSRTASRSGGSTALQTALLGLCVLGSLLAFTQARAQTTPQAANVSDIKDQANALQTTQHVLRAFTAQYVVLRGGSTLGNATFSVTPYDNNRWRADLGMHGSGIFSLAGIHADSSTVFDVVGATYRPVSQATVSRVSIFSNKQSVGIYNWVTNTAQWTGDVKPTRAKPIALQPGDLNSLLINLAIVRDAKPGRSLTYRYVDDGRVRIQQYMVATTPELITVGDLEYQTYRVSRTDSLKLNDETILWVVPGGDTPIRMLQREGGKDTYELRLTEYQGAQPK